MENENLINDSLVETLQLLKEDYSNPLEVIKVKYSSGAMSMSEAEWEKYYQLLPSFILENADEEKVVTNFLSNYSVLSNSILEFAVSKESVPLEYITIIIQKCKEELLKIACLQESDDLLNHFLGKDRSFANLKMMNGQYILQYAFQYGSVDIIETLIYYGAILEVEDTKGRNNLHFAALNKNLVIWMRYSNDPRFAKLLERKDSSGEIPHRA